MKTRILLLVATLLPASLFGRTPEQTVEGAFAALRTEGFSGAVDYMHDEDMPAFRRFLAGVVEDLRKRSEKDERSKQVLARLDPDLDKLKGREYVKNVAQVFGRASDLPEPFRQISLSPIGSIREGNLAHVVVRLRIPEKDGVKNEVHVFTVKEVAGEFYFTRGSGQNPFSQFFKKT